MKGEIHKDLILTGYWNPFNGLEVRGVRPEYDAPSTSAPTATATINAPLPSTCDGRCQCMGMQVNMLNRLLENITLFQICLVEQICSKER